MSAGVRRGALLIWWHVFWAELHLLAGNRALRRARRHQAKSEAHDKAVNRLAARLHERERP